MANYTFRKVTIYKVDTTQLQPGLKQNWKQFSLLVAINALVGGMVGMERSIFPQFAEENFGVVSHTAMLSFITTFGVAKAITNYFTGKLANTFGRRNLLLYGWLVAVPVPVLLMYARDWNIVVLANILLGASQGLTWSSTVVMKIDLVGDKDRGLAMGLNEFAGYFAVGIVAFATAWVASHYGVVPYPFYIGLAIAIIGFIATALWVKDTRTFVRAESNVSLQPQMSRVFVETSFTNKTLSAVTQAGLVNNLNDGMIWGLLPVLLMQTNFGIEQVGVITAVYPGVWGLGQLVTGKMGDVYNKKSMLFSGMFLQGVAIVCLPFINTYTFLIGIAALLGLGTALVYPTFLTTIAQATHPAQRAEGIGVFRLWRDAGYAIGAVLSGLVADWLGVKSAIVLIGIVTVLSALVIQIRMPDDVQVSRNV